MAKIIVPLLSSLLCLLFSCKRSSSDPVVSSDSITIDTLTTMATDSSDKTSINLDGWRGGYFQSFKKGDTLKVISPSGVAFKRSAVTRADHSRTLAYSSTVYPLHNLEEGVDDNVVNSVTHDTIAGKWVRVLHEKDTGFVFSAFIGRLHGPTSDHPDFHFLPSNNAYAQDWDGTKEYPCTNNFDFRPGFKYYGIYQTDEGLMLKSVDLQFFVERRDSAVQVWYERYVVKAQSFFDPLYIIGSRTALPEKLLQVPPDIEMQYDGNAFHALSGKLVVGVMRGSIETLYVKENGREIFSKRFAGGRIQPEIKIWADINSDHFTDYIVIFTDTTWTITGLLLGSVNGLQFVGKYENFQCN